MKTGSATLLLVSLVGGGCAHKPPSQPPIRPQPQHAGPTVVRAPAPILAPTPAAAPQDDAIYFRLDVALIRDDDRPILEKVAERLRNDPKAKVRIEGHCDERGTTEYNLALGDKRARAAKQHLIWLGIPESRIEVATFGSERPRNPGHDEDAWAENRRDDLKVR